jgi:hypothetical protein
VTAGMQMLSRVRVPLREIFARSSTLVSGIPRSIGLMISARLVDRASPTLRRDPRRPTRLPQLQQLRVRRWQRGTTAFMRSARPHEQQQIRAASSRALVAIMMHLSSAEVGAEGLAFGRDLPRSSHSAASSTCCERSGVDHRELRCACCRASRPHGREPVSRRSSPSAPKKLRLTAGRPKKLESQSKSLTS